MNASVFVVDKKQFLHDKGVVDVFAIDQCSTCYTFFSVPETAHSMFPLLGQSKGFVGQRQR